MNVLFLTRLYYPHIGGVERHVYEVAKRLNNKGENVEILTERYNDKLKAREVIDGVKVVRFYYPHKKFLGILFVWWQIFKHRKLLEKADVVHIHDVFIWYFPFRFLFPFKRVILTIHGLEWNKPLDKVSLWRKKMAVKLSNKSIGVGKYLEKYLKVKFDLITYGAILPSQKVYSKTIKKIVYVGRLEENTGLGKFLEEHEKQTGYTIEFCGDGPLRKNCEKFGKVHGFIPDPQTFLARAEYCVPGGYLSAMEALNAGCKLKLFWHDELRKDIWNMTPFLRKDARAWIKTQTWEKLANEYLNLYNNI